MDTLLHAEHRERAGRFEVERLGLATPSIASASEQKPTTVDSEHFADT